MPIFSGWNPFFQREIFSPTALVWVGAQFATAAFFNVFFGPILNATIISIFWSFSLLSWPTSSPAIYTCSFVLKIPLILLKSIVLVGLVPPTLAREFWQWCEARRLFSFCVILPSSENVEADFGFSLFFLMKIRNGGSLHSFFERVLSSFGPFSIDLFATRANPKCPLFASGRPDPDAFKVDAFTFSWTEFPRFLCSPAFCHLITHAAKNYSGGSCRRTGFSYMAAPALLSSSPVTSGLPPLIRREFAARGVSESCFRVQVASWAPATLKNNMALLFAVGGRSTTHRSLLRIRSLTLWSFLQHCFAGARLTNRFFLIGLRWLHFIRTFSLICLIASFLQGRFTFTLAPCEVHSYLGP